MVKSLAFHSFEAVQSAIMFTTIMIVIIMMIVSADCSEGADKLMIDSDESDNLPSQAIENSPPQSQVCPQRHSEIYYDLVLY